MPDENSSEIAEAIKTHAKAIDSFGDGLDSKLGKLLNMLRLLVAIIGIEVLFGFFSLYWSFDMMQQVEERTRADFEEKGKTSLERLEEAETELERFYALGDAAKMSFEMGDIATAAKYAEELAGLAPKYKARGRNGNAIHDSNLVLGRIAVREGNIEAAKAYLVEAGRTPGSPNLNSFGPNVSLAKDLLEKGETEIVIAYFEACKTFWEMDRGRLDSWIALAREGKIPYFGANLDY